MTRPRRTNYHGAGLASSSMENECPRCGDDNGDPLVRSNSPATHGHPVFRWIGAAS